MKQINIAIDGPAGSGKSSAGLEVARQLGYQFIDTGLTYRAFTWYCLKRTVDWSNSRDIHLALQDFDYWMANDVIHVNMHELKIDDSALYNDDILAHINSVTGLDYVRDKMVAIQRKMAEASGVVMVGRDITSVVLPNAQLKIYLTSSVEVRAARRLLQNEKQLLSNDLADVTARIIKRDDFDMHRSDGPLVCVADAWKIDNSKISLQATIAMIVSRAKAVIAQNNGEQGGTDEKS